MEIDYKELINTLQIAIREQGKEIIRLKEDLKILSENVDARIKIVELKVESLEPELIELIKEDIEDD